MTDELQLRQPIADGDELAGFAWSQSYGYDGRAAADERDLTSRRV